MEDQKKLRWNLLIGPVAVLLIVVLGYVVSNEATKKVYRDFKPIAYESSEANNTTTPTQPPVDKTKYTISVLNGSGITGQAGEFKTMLEEAGFVVKSTGNADRQTYARVVISARQNVAQSFLDELKRTIENSYEVDKVSETIERETPTDIEIITAPNK